MINRLADLAGEAPEEDAYGDFFVVSGPFGSLAVTAGTAHAIVRMLGRRRPPRWISFNDRSGSPVCLRARDVRSICESTAAQRAYDRRMARAREREERADRGAWDDD